MASTIVKRGKLFMDICYKEDLQRSFKIHRDLKSCVSLRDAMKVYKENEVVILNQQQTAFLQYLNSYPLSYNLRNLNSPLCLFYESLKMKNLSIYEQAMKMGALSSLKVYVNKMTKNQISQQLRKISSHLNTLLSQQKLDPVDGISLLMMQKEQETISLSLHCLESLKSIDLQILQIVFPKVTPVIIKRVNINDWGTLRKFKNILDFTIYDWTSKDQTDYLEIENFKNIIQLQLHLIGYQKIPKRIEEFINKISNSLIDTNSSIDFMTLQYVFESFQYLPLSYNEKAYQIIKAELFKRCKSNSKFLQFQRLPYNRLLPSQIKQIYQTTQDKDSILDLLLFTGNNLHVRKCIMNTNSIEILYKSHCQMKVPNWKNFCIIIVSTDILCSHYEKDANRIKNILQTTENLFNSMDVFKNIRLTASILPLAVIFKGIELSEKYNFNVPFQSYFQVFSQRDKQFSSINFLSNVLEAVEGHSNSHSKVVVNCINNILIQIALKSNKFHFRFYPNFIFHLEKSDHSQQYQQTIKKFYQLLPSEDCPYFVEIYNRFPSKSYKLNTAVIKAIWNKQHSFKSIGKFLTNSNYGIITLPKGSIILQLQQILTEIKLLLNVQQQISQAEDLQEFMLSQMTYIIKLFHHFIHNPNTQLLSFFKKFILLTFTYIQHINLEREGIKVTMKYVEALSSFALALKTESEFAEKILKLLQKVKKIFPSSVLIKTKQLEIKWVIGRPENQDRVSLIIPQILEDLSLCNYSVIYFDVILTLLKLNAYQIIPLSSATQTKLQKIILQSLNNHEVGAIEIVNNFPILKNHPNKQINNNKFQALAKIMIKCLQQVKHKQNFQFYKKCLQLAHPCKNTQLLELTLAQITHIHLYPNQLREIFKVIKFFPSLNINQFAYNIIHTLKQYSHSLNFALNNILFILHNDLYNIPPHQLNIYEELELQNVDYLLSKIPTQQTEENQQSDQNTQSTKNQLISILKALWISIKTNRITVKTIQLYNHLEKHQNFLQTFSQSHELYGLTKQFLDYLLKAYQQTVKQQPQKRKHFFKSKTTEKKYITIFPVQLKIRSNYQQLNPEQQNSIKQQIEALQLHRLKIKKNQKATNNHNGYLQNYNVNTIVFPYWIIKDQQQYGILIINKNCLDHKLQKRGKVLFLQNALTIITQANIIPLLPGEKISIN